MRLDAKDRVRLTLSNAFTNSCSSSKHSGLDCSALSADFAGAFGVDFDFFAMSRILAQRVRFKARPQS